MPDSYTEQLPYNKTQPPEKRKLGFDDIKEIDTRIYELDRKMQTESLTLTQEKEKMIEQVREHCEKFPRAYVISIENDRNNFMQEIRKRLRPGVIVLDGVPVEVVVVVDVSYVGESSSTGTRPAIDMSQPSCTQWCQLKSP